MADKALRILVIPDTQCKPGVPLDHCDWIGKAIVDYEPDVVVHLDDHWDMPSLSSHDKAGSKYFEGKRYVADVEAGNEGMRRLLAPLKELQAKQKKNKEKVYRPRLVLTMGNHTQRIERAVNNNPMLEGLMSFDDLDLKDWEVIPFLHPVFINGVGFSHFWPQQGTGRAISSAAALLNKLHMSVVAGHAQGRQVAYSKRADGKPICAIIAGSCYLHNEEYITGLNNEHWRGLVVLNEVKDGSFDEMFVSLDYMKRKYG